MKGSIAAAAYKSAVDSEEIQYADSFHMHSDSHIPVDHMPPPYWHPRFVSPEIRPDAEREVGCKQQQAWASLPSLKFGCDSGKQWPLRRLLAVVRSVQRLG